MRRVLLHALQLIEGCSKICTIQFAKISFVVIKLFGAFVIEFQRSKSVKTGIYLFLAIGLFLPMLLPFSFWFWWMIPVVSAIALGVVLGRHAILHYTGDDSRLNLTVKLIDLTSEFAGIVGLIFLAALLFFPESDMILRIKSMQAGFLIIFGFMFGLRSIRRYVEISNIWKSIN